MANDFSFLICVIDKSFINSVKMSDIKILKNVSAFNEIYFKNCFYQALFPIVMHFGKCIEPFIWNYLFIYCYDNKKTKIPFELKAVPKYSLEHLFLSQGIGFNGLISTNDIIESLVLSISKLKPVIISVDLYYESINPMTYKKYHWPHMITVYGFDNNESAFNVIEYGYPYRVSTERTISYLDVLKSYNGFLQNIYKPNMSPSYLEYYKLENDLKYEHRNSVYIFREQSINNLRKNKDKIFSGFDCIKKFSKDFKTIFFNELTFKKYARDLHQCFVRLIRYKISEGYFIERLLPSMSKYMDLFHLAENSWKLIFAITQKHGFSLKNKSKSVELVLKKLSDIYEYENRFYSTLFTKL